MSAAKNWCFTINNYTQSDYEKLEVMFNHEHFSYIVYGKEVGDQGTPHLQGYVQFKKKMRLNQAKKFISPRAHMEVSRGSPDVASGLVISAVDTDFLGIVKRRMIIKS